jgi:hypothetical protein
MESASGFQLNSTTYILNQPANIIYSQPRGMVIESWMGRYTYINDVNGLTVTLYAHNKREFHFDDFMRLYICPQFPRNCYRMCLKTDRNSFAPYFMLNNYEIPLRLVSLIFKHILHNNNKNSQIVNQECDHILNTQIKFRDKYCMIM